MQRGVEERRSGAASRHFKRAVLVRSLIATLAIVLGGCASGCRGERVVVTMAAAVSLNKVLPELAAAFAEEDPRPELRFVYGASGDLKKRVIDGAPFDAVLFASGAPVDELARGGQVEAATTRVVAHNRLVLVGRPGGAKATFATLESLPAGERIAIGDPAPVPAGEYAKRALTALGTWPALEARMVYGGDVSAVLAYARRGEVAAAIVYTTELRGLDDVVVLDEARGSWAPSPEVVAAMVVRAEHAEPARRFLAFLAKPKGQAILERAGFLPAQGAKAPP